MDMKKNREIKLRKEGKKNIEKMYREIATLERSIKIKVEKSQSSSIIKGKKFDYEKTLKRTYISTYKKIIKIANKILEEEPEEIVAREKLLKALFITGKTKQAEETANEILNTHNRDEIALWYLSKIEREKGNFAKEKECLEAILANSPEGTQINAQKRLVKVNLLLERQKGKEQIKQGKKENYTEEARQEFIDQAKRDFIYGNIGLTEIEQLIQEAKKYPNFIKSLIVLIDIKSKITENKQDKIDELESYIDGENLITQEEYNDILEEITNTRKEIEEDSMVEQYWDRKKKEEAKKQREYSKDVIKKLSKGEIKKEDLPEIVGQLEKFKDRTRAIFLITKLYEILYDKERAYNELIKYTYIADLTPEEQRGIAKMQKILMEGKNEQDESTNTPKRPTTDEQGGDSSR